MTHVFFLFFSFIAIYPFLTHIMDFPFGKTDFKFKVMLAHTVLTSTLRKHFVCFEASVPTHDHNFILFFTIPTDFTLIKLLSNLILLSLKLPQFNLIFFFSFFWLRQKVAVPTLNSILRMK